MTVSTPAFAKINLFLDIRSIRENGYHNILSIMQRVSLCDMVTVSLAKGENKEISVRCDKESIPCGSDNLAYKAAALYPVEGKIDIFIEKHIPMSAGLAGGSADAAATLISLNKLCSDKLSVDELCALGEKLGADVPFCIKGGACLVEGIGEIMTPITPMPQYPIIIAKKGDGMSTPAAYRALDEKFNKFKNYSPKEELCDIIRSSETDPKSFCLGLYNIFEAVVEPARPAVSELKETMRKYGASGAMMSGSGTSVFGIFNNESDAKKALNALIELGADAHLCYPA